MTIFDNQDQEITETGSTIGNPYGFTGRRWDAGTGLWYYRNRMYSPFLGRFMQRDPAGYVDGVNLYAYVRNNPLGYLDPEGLVARKAVKASYEALVGSANLINETIVFPALDILALPTNTLDYLGQNIDFVGEAIGRSSEERQAIAASVFGPMGPDDAVLGVVGALGKLPKIAKGLTTKNLSPRIKTLSEANITDKGITVLGRYQAPPGQTNYIQKATTGKYKGSSYFDLGDAWTPIEGKAANQHFLDIIGERGDKIIFSTPKNKIPAGTSLDTEVKYLKEKFNYKWVNQWSMQKR